MARARVSELTVDLDLVGGEDVEHLARLATLVPMDVAFRQQRTTDAGGGTGVVTKAHDVLWPVDAIRQLVLVEAFARGTSPRAVLDEVLSGIGQPDVTMTPGWVPEEQA